MRRETQHVLLLLLGGALIKITLNGDYLRYVRPSHGWVLLAAGAVMVLLAGWGLLRDFRTPPTELADHDGHHGSPGQTGHSPWLLMLPVLAVFLVSPPALGADAVGRAESGNTVSQRPAADFPPLPSGPAPSLKLSELVTRAAWDRSGELAGREIVVTGFVVRRGASVQLARLAIACCAADARPVRLRLDGAGLDYPPDTWLRVHGTVQPGSATAASEFVPAMTVTSAEVVAAPADPYEY